MPRVPIVLAAALVFTPLAAPTPATAQAFTATRVDVGGAGGHDYLTADPSTGRLFISRGTHVMVVDAGSGRVVGDIADTPRVHGIAFAPRSQHGFTTNAGDSTLTMFDLRSLAVLRKIHAGTDGLDGIMYDATTDRILSIDHSHPMGTAVAVDATTGAVVGTIRLSGGAPEGGVSDGRGRIFINIEDRNAIDVIDARTLRLVATWPIAPCDGPTGIAYDATSNRIFAGCSTTSVVVDGTSGKVVATLANGDGVDGIGWDAAQRLLYIPAGRDGTVTVVHQDAPDRYTTLATVPTMRGTKTIAVDSTRHRAYALALAYGPAPAGAPAAGGRPARGPVTNAWLYTVAH